MKGRRGRKNLSCLAQKGTEKIQVRPLDKFLNTPLPTYKKGGCPSHIGSLKPVFTSIFWKISSFIYRRYMYIFVHIIIFIHSPYIYRFIFLNCIIA